MNGNGCLDRGFEEIVTGLGGSIWICTGLSGAGIDGGGLDQSEDGQHGWITISSLLFRL
jgi:hypothetical protein